MTQKRKGFLCGNCGCRRNTPCGCQLPKGKHKVSGYHKLNVNRDKAPIDTGIAEAIKFVKGEVKKLK